ncbi:MAG: SDR family oxidoreductase [Bacteroidota bacterium]
MSHIEEIFSLKGKSAIVIGGSGTLGSEMSRALASAGADTAIFYSGNREGAETTAASVEKMGVRSSIHQVDVRSSNSIQEAVDTVCDAWGGIDILINAPGVNSATPLMEIEEEEWDRILEINLKGVFLATRIVGQKMIEQGRGGSVINISSASSDIPLSRVFTYSISKAGMNNMTRFLAREWAGEKIRVNAIKPGFFPAEQNRKILTKERQQSIFNHTPMNRYGEAEELSGAVIWLASEAASSFVTGAVIPVDGGFTAMTI